MYAGMEALVTARPSVGVLKSSQVRSVRRVCVTMEIVWAAPATVVRDTQVSRFRCYNSPED